MFPSRDEAAVSQEHIQGKQKLWADYRHAAIYLDPLWF